MRSGQNPLVVQDPAFFRERFWEAGIAPDAEGGVDFDLIPGAGLG